MPPLFLIPYSLSPMDLHLLLITDSIAEAVAYLQEKATKYREHAKITTPKKEKWLLE